MTLLDIRSVKSNHAVSHKAATFAMALFLLSLALLFLASLLVYLLIRLGIFGNMPGGLPAIGSMQLSPWLWASTAVILVSSATIQFAVASVRRERQRDLRVWLWLTMALAVLFTVIQAPALYELYGRHAEAKAATSNGLYGAIMFLIIVHALHVIGGIVALGIVLHGAVNARYDHEHYGPLKHTAMYWHFLDVVWIVLYATLLVTG